MNAVDRLSAQIRALRSEYTIFEVWAAPFRASNGEPEFVGTARAFTFAEACAMLLGDRMGFDFETCTYYSRNLWPSREYARMFV